MINKVFIFTLLLVSLSILNAQSIDMSRCKQFNEAEYQTSLENTRKNNPELYNRAQQQKSLGKINLTSDTLGTEKWFFVQDDVSQQFQSVQFRLRYIGTMIRLWVSISEWDINHVNQNVLDQLKEALEVKTPVTSKDPNKGIIELINEYYGDFPDYDGDQITDFLICDIKDSYNTDSTSSYIAGYFYSLDQSTRTFSNQADILYLDSYPAIYKPKTKTITTQQVLGTSAHELQHLVHYNYDKSEITFVNEGLSEVTAWICGYNMRNPDLYFDNLNVNLLTWETISGDVLIDYSRAALFTLYYAEQLGADILKNIVKNTKVGEASLTEEFKKKNASVNLKQMYINFCYANYIKNKSVSSSWGYKYNVKGRPKLTVTINDPNTYSGIHSFTDYSVAYMKINSKNFDDTLKVIPEAVDGEAYRINFNKNADPNVEIITLGQEEIIPAFKSSYDSLVYVAFNFSGFDRDYAIEAKGTDNKIYWKQIFASGGNASQIKTFNNGYFLASVGSSFDLNVSIDNGDSWGYYSTPSGVFDACYNSSIAEYFIGTQDGVYYSDSTFQEWFKLGNLDKSIYALAIDPGGNMFAGTFMTGIYKVGFDMTNWESFTNGITGGNLGYTVHYFAVDKAGSVFAFISKSESDGTFKSEIYKLPLGGSIWLKVNSFSDQTLSFVYDGPGDNIYGVYNGKNIYKYSDNGTNWIQMKQNLFSVIIGMTVNPKNSNEILVISNKGTYQTFDGGLSWIERNNGFYYGKDENLYSIAYNKNGAIVTSSEWTYYKFNNSATGLKDMERTPLEYSLKFNYPNPFNPSTTIEYYLAEPSDVKLIIYNLLGEEVITLVNKFESAGSHRVNFNASVSKNKINLASGVYFYQLKAGAYVQTKKMMMLK